MARYKSIRNTLSGQLLPVNSELEKIANTQEDHLSRKGDSPNQMETDLDMNSRRIYNLPEPVSDHEPLTFKKGKNILEESELQADRAEQEADRAESEATQAANSATTAGVSAEEAGQSAAYLEEFLDDWTFEQMQFPLDMGFVTTSVIRANYDLGTVI